MADYSEKLLLMTQFVEENFSSAPELVAVLGLTVEDIINLLPDVLVANYNLAYENETDEEEDWSLYDGVGEEWEE